jgi:hypothetical protein
MEPPVGLQLRRWLCQKLSHDHAEHCADGH